MRSFGALSVILLLCSLTAFGTPIWSGPYSTGFGDWFVAERPAGGGVTAATILSPVGDGWWPNNDSSKWIGVPSTETGSGNYLFFSSFTVNAGLGEGALIGTFDITGRWASYNRTQNVWLNGVAQNKEAMGGSDHSVNPFYIDNATADGGYPFVITGPIYQGQNEISFRIHRDEAEGLFGLRVEFDPPTDIDVVPEPGTITLLGIGLAGMVAFSLRRKRS